MKGFRSKSIDLNQHDKTDKEKNDDNNLNTSVYVTPLW